MELIVTFKNTHYAICAEQAALSSGIQVSVMSLPSNIQAGCGLCLRVSGDKLDKLKQVLTTDNILYSGVYQRRVIPHSDCYTFFEGGNHNR